MELYARTYLTENEHWIINESIGTYCNLEGLNLHYYRKLKEGHIPMWREFKVSGERGKVLEFVDEYDTVIDNRWRGKSLLEIHLLR